MEIHWHNPDAVPDADRARAHERLEALSDGRRDLIDVWVDVKPSTHHRRGGDEVAIRCMARGAELVARRTGDEPRQALQEALRAFEREVQRMRARRTDRRTEREPEPPHLAVVDRLFPDREYGFLVTEGGEQVYFHKNAVGEGLEFDRLEVGQRVALNLEVGADGPQATVVTPAPPG